MSRFISLYMVFQALASVNLGERGSGPLSFLGPLDFAHFCSLDFMDCASLKNDALTDR